MKNKDDTDDQIFSTALVLDEATHFISEPKYDTPIQKVFRRATNYITQSRRAEEMMRIKYADIDYAELELKTMSGIFLVKDIKDWPKGLTCDCGFKTTTSDSLTAHRKEHHAVLTNRA